MFTVAILAQGTISTPWQPAGLLGSKLAPGVFFTRWVRVLWQPMTSGPEFFLRSQPHWDPPSGMGPGPGFFLRFQLQWDPPGARDLDFSLGLGLNGIHQEPGTWIFP